MQPAGLVQYTQPWQTNVNGVIKARFKLDARGAPDFVPDDSLKHYWVEVWLESPNADKIDRVTYFMDDETFYDDTAVSEDRDDQFRETIQTYGDFEIETRVQMGRHQYKQRAWLSNLLEAGHDQDLNQPAIRRALNDIQSN